jgi:glutamate dehydrogenase
MDAMITGTVGADRLRTALADALGANALPGELAGFGTVERNEAVGFLLDIAGERAPGVPAIALGRSGGEGARRWMRLGVINDDMPFLVDSMAAAIGARGLEIYRLLHPVAAVRRESGRLASLLPPGAEGERHESLVYMEVERADARDRRTLIDELHGVLADVRAAVSDWPAMRAALAADAGRLPDGEGAALLRWFGDRHFTMLGHQIEARDGSATSMLGVLRQSGPWLWDEGTREAAFAHFERGGEAPLVLKSPRESTVHRRAPLDLLAVPVRAEGRVDRISLHAGLWTSAALGAAPEKVPILRARLASLAEKFGFDPSGHAGKALRHALSALPHDLLVGLEPAALEGLALTAMSLADRPRPKLAMVPAAIGRTAFGFVWLPREELTTARRVAIGEMLASSARGRVANWTVAAGDADLALIRYTIEREDDHPLPELDSVDRRIEAMVRGWVPAVEDQLAALVGPSRASRMALSFAAGFPAGYRADAGPEDAAADIVRLQELGGQGARGVRLHRRDDDGAGIIRLKVYRKGGAIALSDAVPAFENFGFRVVEEFPTLLEGGRQSIHDFVMISPGEPDSVLARAAVAEAAIAAVLEGRAENDAFNQLILANGLAPRDVVLLRAWFRYLRQTGLSYGLLTVVEALRRAPAVAEGLIALFYARHDPAAAIRVEDAETAIASGLQSVAAIDDDRILRRFRAVVEAVLRTNAFVPAGQEALAFKLDPAIIPGLPAPVPWREIWVYSPRVEGIHLRGGPIARGGLRWSDRRDDFRTEILGLMKAQVVKNAVIVPTGAKGGFYPKLLPSPANRDAWLAEGTESYRIFIRALLSVTDNLSGGLVEHPAGMAVLDGDDPYFVVAADKGTATFSDVANGIAVERGFWLGDAFASGGSAGYDHKAMGITARGAWVSVARHFAERGVDVQADPITVAGCGDMSGDVFGNGMLLSQSIRLVAAFDHRHIFLDPHPDPAASWAERERLFRLPRSSWADYDPSELSPGGGIFPRSQKAIPLSAEVRAVLGIDVDTLDPAGLIAAILKAPVDLLWFGGIGTYIKASGESHQDAGDPANDTLRVDADQLRATAIGEGANLSITQGGRIEFALRGGRNNTDFVDNSAGVDCSDNEVNIKIALNREMAEGRLSREDRDRLLAGMTDDVARLVLEDNRLQTLALSLAERGGAAAVPAYIRVIEALEASGRLDRRVEGLPGNEALSRRAQDGAGLTRPELAVLTSHAKLALQAAIEKSALAGDPLVEPVLMAAFPPAMRERFAPAIHDHALRGQIIATKLANRLVNRLGVLAPFELVEEAGCSLALVAAAYVTVDRLFGLDRLWADIEEAPMPEEGRLALFSEGAAAARLHMADALRAMPGDAAGAFVEQLRPGMMRLADAATGLLRAEARQQSEALGRRLASFGADPSLIERVRRLSELDGAIGVAALAATQGFAEVETTEAYVRLGEAIGLDWAKSAALRLVPADAWDRLLAASLARDFEQLRIEFLARAGGPPVQAVERWLSDHAPRVLQFRALVDRARAEAGPSAAMLAQIAVQARSLLTR